MERSTIVRITFSYKFGPQSCLGHLQITIHYGGTSLCEMATTPEKQEEQLHEDNEDIYV